MFFSYDLNSFSVDGLFTEWLTWSHCSVSCGGSLRNRTRSCIGPFFGGKDCDGPRNDSEVCGETPCPGNDKKYLHLQISFLVYMYEL